MNTEFTFHGPTGKILLKYKCLKYFCRQHLATIEILHVINPITPDNNPSNQSLIKFIDRHPLHIRSHNPEIFDIELWGILLTNLDNAKKARNRKMFNHYRHKLFKQSYDFHQPELMDFVNKIIYKSNGEIFESRYKAITITIKKKQKKDDFKNLIIKFFGSKKFKSYYYCIEHISTNMHAHIATEFSAKKLRPNILKESFYKVFDPDIYHLTLKDSNGHCHLRSKTIEQIEGWVGYIDKDEEDKEIGDTKLNIQKKNIRE